MDYHIASVKRSKKKNGHRLVIAWGKLGKLKTRSNQTTVVSSPKLPATFNYKHLLQWRMMRNAFFVLLKQGFVTLYASTYVTIIS